MSSDMGKKSDCRTAGYGVFQPRASCHRMRFSASLGAASGSRKFMRVDATAARRRAVTFAPVIAPTRRFFSSSDCFGSIATYGRGSAGAPLSRKLARMSVATRSKIDIAGSPSISSTVFTMLGCE